MKYLSSQNKNESATRGAQNCMKHANILCHHKGCELLSIVLGKAKIKQLVTMATRNARRQQCKIWRTTWSTLVCIRSQTCNCKKGSDWRKRCKGMYGAC